MRDRFFVIVLLILGFCPAMGQQAWGAGSLRTTVLDGVTVEYYVPQELRSKLTADGKTVQDAVPAVVYIANPVPPDVPIRIPSPATVRALQTLGEPEKAVSTFSITYIPDGGTDLWGEPCFEFPAEAQAAINAAAIIWGNLIQSSVPITVRVGWANLTGGTLGYSGGGNFYRDFPGAPKTNTWYRESLANSLNGSDLDPTAFDMHITYSKNFSWYYGTDGNTPGGQYDLMSVALHEIAHGLNFAGSMSYSAGQGSWGGGTGFPVIYDTFTRDGGGTALTNTSAYPNPSTALGSALTSSSIWFHGSNAMAANGGQRVKLYAPSSWAAGSSYSHLDYTTFAGTVNQLMVYAMSSASSIHDPGPVTKGLLIDLGWICADLFITTTTFPAGSVEIPYSQNVSAIGGILPYAWSISAGSLPTGNPAFAINPSTGVITGTPTIHGTFNFTVQVTDSQDTPDTASKALSIVINPADLSITTTSLFVGSVGTAYNQSISGTGGVGSYTWSITSGTLPANLTLNPSTGVITGTPTTAGTFNFTVQVTDSQDTPDTASKALSITINPAVLTVIPNNQDVVSTADTTTFAVSNTGAGTMNWTTAVNTGSEWLSITSGSNGTNSGTITVGFTQNTIVVGRIGTITVTAIGATGSPKDITVTQDAAASSGGGGGGGGGGPVGPLATVISAFLIWWKRRNNSTAG